MSDTDRVPTDDDLDPDERQGPSWAEWWASLPGAARTGIAAGVGVPLWILWLIGGVVIADGLWRAWWPLGVAWLAIDVGVAVGIPVWLACRDLDRA